MVDYPHLSASSSSCSSSRDLFAEFGVSNPNDASLSVGLCNESAASFSSSASGGAPAGVDVSSSIPCVAMGESEPLPQVLAICSEESSKGANSNEVILGIPSNSDIQNIFKAAHHFAQNDRIEATSERKKNLDLLNFLVAHGHSISEVNDFVRSGGSLAQTSIAPPSLEVGSPSNGLVNVSCPREDDASGVHLGILTNSHSHPMFPALNPAAAAADLQVGGTPCLVLNQPGGPCLGPLDKSSKSVRYSLACPAADATDLQVGGTPCLAQCPMVFDQPGGPSLCPLDNSSETVRLACSTAAISSCEGIPIITNFPLSASLDVDPSKVTDCIAPKEAPAIAAGASDLPHPSSFISKTFGPAQVPIAESSLPKPVAPKSWSSIVAADASQVPLHLGFFPPSVVNGQVSIRPPKDILKKGNGLWSSCLVGHFLHSRLPFKLVEETSFKIWGHLGLQRVFLHGKDSFIFKFAKPDDRANILALGPWYLSNKLLHLQYWKEGLNFHANSCSKTPIWVKFHHIPLSYWTPEGLSYLASGIGKPLFVDKQTERMEPMNFARVCIEINVDSVLPDSIFAVVLDEESASEISVEIKVDYQNRPASCHLCKSFGHSIYKCPQSNFQWLPKAKPASPDLCHSADDLASKATMVHTSPVLPAESVVPPAAALSVSGLDKATDSGARECAQEWTTVDRGRGVVLSPSPACFSPEPACTPVSNAFMAIADATELDLISSPDVTPIPNPLIDKLKLVDEKEGRDLKNKDRLDHNHASTPKKKNRRNGGRKSPS